MAKPLTVRTLETLKPGDARKEVPDGLVRGLFFIVQPSGNTSWAARYRVGGQSRKLTLGTYPAIDLKAARDEKVAEQFIARHVRATMRPSWAREAERMVRKEIIGAWKGRKLSEIRKADIHELLDSIVDRPAPIVANRVLATFRRMCGWAIERGLMDTSPCLNIRAPAPEQSRDRVLSDDELRPLWQCARLAVWEACSAVGPYWPAPRRGRRNALV